MTGRSAKAALIGAGLAAATAATWLARRDGVPWLRATKAYVYGFPLIMMDLTKEAGAAATGR